MSDNLSSSELVRLIKTVFPPQENDRNLAILVDLPDLDRPDNPKWERRRELAYQWSRMLREAKDLLGLDSVSVICYQNVSLNNANLPEICWKVDDPPTEWDQDFLRGSRQAIKLEESLSGQNIILAPTEFSTTAPLKLLARKYGFRAATMPGFSEAMIPALRLDWSEVASRVNMVKERLDRSDKATIEFLVDSSESYTLELDLRFRSATASNGLFPKPGMAGNLPSGETYIVPYEGELEERSLSAGIMPVQFDQEVVLYEIEANRAVKVLSEGQHSKFEANKLLNEPAYGNIAELGIGVLSPLGIKPIGEILLDEKLGLHIAFGRSDHFGGAPGPGQFKNAANVEHIDRIYIQETQPRVTVKACTLIEQRGETLLMENGEFMIF